MSDASGDNPVARMLRTDVLVAHPEEGVWDLITILRLAGLSEVPVVNDGVVVGMVTRQDLVRAVRRTELPVGRTAWGEAEDGAESAFGPVAGERHMANGRREFRPLNHTLQPPLHE